MYRQLLKDLILRFNKKAELKSCCSGYFDYSITHSTANSKITTHIIIYYKNPKLEGSVKLIEVSDSGNDDLLYKRAFESFIDVLSKPYLLPTSEELHKIKKLWN